MHSHYTKIPDSCTQNPDEVPGKVCPGYKYKSDTILFPSIGFSPGFEYKPLDEFRSAIRLLRRLAFRLGRLLFLYACFRWGYWRYWRDVSLQLVGAAGLLGKLR